MQGSEEWPWGKTKKQEQLVAEGPGSSNRRPQHCMFHFIFQLLRNPLRMDVMASTHMGFPALGVCICTV